ncbi:MAG: hypothetical protein RLZZ241_629 [Bacteroidota bacterium]
MNTFPSKRIFYPLFLLLIPMVGMAFSDQVNWSVFDFVVMGVLLLSLGFGIHLVVTKIKNRSNRLIPILILIVVFLLVWAELAVGIFGSPFAGS